MAGIQHGLRLQNQCDLEGAYALRGAPAAGARDIALIQLRAAGALERCPFLDGNACGIHTIKPLACRTYFCDGATREWQQELTERGLREVRALHDGFGLEYRYAEWGWVIGLLRASAG